MIKLDDKYKVDKKIPMKDFIPNQLSPADRRKIKENVKSCTLTYQIAGEEIPSHIEDGHNAQVIQYYEFELFDIKKADTIAKMYQQIIKNPCVFRLHDNNREAYSLGLKKVNQQDDTKVVVTDNFITKDYHVTIPDGEKVELEAVIEVDNVMARQNKMTAYLEMYVKAFLLTKGDLCSKEKSKDILGNKEIWYNEHKVREVYQLVKELEQLDIQRVKARENKVQVEINKRIKEVRDRLEEV